MTENSTHSSADRVLVSARVFADEPPPGRLSEDIVTQGRSGVGRWYSSFRMNSLEAADASERQNSFEAVLTQLRRDFAEAGIDAEYVRSTNAEIELDISLAPSGGQAGIVLTRELLANWEGLNLSVYVDALAG
jgi:hypothetical protein